MKFSKPVIIAALMAGNLIAWDLAIRAQDTTNTPPTTPPPAARGRPGFDRIAQQLNLTDAEKPQVKAVLDAMNQQNRDVRQDTSLSRADRQAKMQAIRSDANTKLKAILTADQFEKWQTLMPQRGGRRPPPPSGTPAGTNAPPQQ